MIEKERPNWDEYFMFSALWAAARSSCWDIHTGTVIVRDKRIIASGYNGAPAGTKNCLEIGCRKKREGVAFEEKGKKVCRGVHAERNAMDQVSRELLPKTKIYTLCYPCSECAKSIATCGIEEVIYSKMYNEPDSLTEEIFSEKGIGLRKLELDVEKYFKMIRGVYTHDSRNR